MIIDNKSYENKTIKVSCYIDASNEDELNLLAKEIKKWIFGSSKYSDLIFSNDLGIKFKAICKNSIDISQLISSFAEVQIIFECTPLADTIDSKIKINIDKNKKIFNPYIKSYPEIKVYGQGDVVISINSQELILKGIEGHIIVNSDIMNTYKEVINGKLINENQKMFSDFPYLEPGTNNISWTGNIEKIEIIPNWVAI